MYPIRYTDSKGQPLTGDKKYSVRFSSEPPVGAFWSLTVYNADDKMLIENPIHRYKVGSSTPGLVKEKDGSFTLTIQHDKPDNAANWAPTPSGGFYLILRLYQPKQSTLDNQWQLPQVDPLQ